MVHRNHRADAMVISSGIQSPCWESRAVLSTATAAA